MWVPEVLLPPKRIRMIGPKTAIFVPKYAFLGRDRPCRLNWCPLGWVVGSCGAWAVSCKTPIYLITLLEVQYIAQLSQPACH